jgi:hypothetical protein
MSAWVVNFLVPGVGPREVVEMEQIAANFGL